MCISYGYVTHDDFAQENFISVAQLMGVKVNNCKCFRCMERNYYFSRWTRAQEMIESQLQKRDYSLDTRAITLQSHSMTVDIGHDGIPMTIKSETVLAVPIVYSGTGFLQDRTATLTFTPTLLAQCDANLDVMIKWPDDGCSRLQVCWKTAVLGPTVVLTASAANFIDLAALDEFEVCPPHTEIPYLTSVDVVLRRTTPSIPRKISLNNCNCVCNSTPVSPCVSACCETISSTGCLLPIQGSVYQVTGFTIECGRCYVRPLRTEVDIYRPGILSSQWIGAIRGLANAITPFYFCDACNVLMTQQWHIDTSNDDKMKSVMPMAFWNLFGIPALGAAFAAKLIRELTADSDVFRI